ncbi:MAG: ZIP family metal transporter [Candidatus Cloacimonetes bacterium]|nr:ZIP family metal transporter [Candidatus Cloacimonadota bacterium]
MQPAEQNSSIKTLIVDCARYNRWTAFFLLVSTAGVGWLLAQSVYMIATNQVTAAFLVGMTGGLIGFVSTGLGALPALFIKSIPQKLEDILLGFAAGMMLAASAFSLILPGLEASVKIVSTPALASMVVVFGMGLGVILMLGLDTFMPHHHEFSGPCGPGHQNLNPMWLFVFAIALHNLPEGMAIGVSLSQEDFSVGIPLTSAIAIQNVPEGLTVALTLRAIGASPKNSVLVALLTGAMEPLGALIGVSLGTGLAIAYPIGLGLAAGAMIFVVSHEVIPETHRNGHQTVATIGLMLGFALMMILDTVLG